MTRIHAEYAIAAQGGAVMPVAAADTTAARAIARPYLLNGALLVTRKVTITPVHDSGTAAVQYGPWREIRTTPTMLAAA